MTPNQQRAAEHATTLDALEAEVQTRIHDLEAAFDSLRLGVPVMLPEPVVLNGLLSFQLSWEKYQGKWQFVVRLLPRDESGSVYRLIDCAREARAAALTAALALFEALPALLEAKIEQRREALANADLFVNAIREWNAEQEQKRGGR